MSWGLSIATFFSAVLLVPIAFSAEDSLLEESRALTDTFAGRLSSALKLAMSEGGPVQALTVCKDIAPQITSELSRSSGAKVTRTSIRYRNPSNKPEQWQQSVLENFAVQIADANGKQLHEHFEPGSPTRYARAILISGQCLACHGSSVSEDVRELLEREYPFDRAIGYRLGELRGFFGVSWPTQ